MVTEVKSAKEISAMRQGGRMLATVLNLLRGRVVPGITTQQLADIAAKELATLGGEPAFLGYQGFPGVICISVNDEVVHGIPKSDKIIQSGDIVGLDFGVRYRGLITDAAISVIADKPKQPSHSQLLKDTEVALAAGIDVVKDRIRTGDIGYAVETVLNRRRYGIVRDLVGHGIGQLIHEDPNIPNFGRADTGPWLVKGMTIAIEPMVTLGTDQVKLAPDGWTILTADGSMSAHFEHTIVITEAGSEVLTTLSA